MAAEVPHTLEYRGGQLNVVPILKDEEEVSSDENEGIEVKVFMALAGEERVSIGKESASNGEWVKISYIKGSTLLLESVISEDYIPTQKKKILGIDQLPEDSSSSKPKDLVFVKSSADNSNYESQRNTTGPSVAVTDSSASDYNSADESSVCSTLLPPLENLAGVNPVSGLNTIKSILKS
ncbi:hypothetical protein Tco_1025659 [Tanacetum coccineum]